MKPVAVSAHLDKQEHYLTITILCFHEWQNR